jgi:hypothetical protein
MKDETDRRELVPAEARDRNICRDPRSSTEAATEEVLEMTLVSSKQRTVSSWSDVRSLRQVMMWQGPGDAVRAYQFQVPELALEDNRRLESAVNRAMNDCGCRLGALLMSGSAVCAGAYQYLSTGGWDEVSWRAAGATVAVAVAGGVLGKLMAMALARLNAMRVIDSYDPLRGQAAAGADGTTGRG